VLKKRLAWEFEHSDESFPDALVSNVVSRFGKNIEKYCNEEDISQSSVCVDVALNDAINPTLFPSRMKKALWKIIIDFSRRGYVAKHRR
jgi:hypothetical protein